MSSDILRMFEGLTTDQAKEFRQRIVPALESVRAEIVSKQTTTERKNTMKTEQARRNLEAIKQDNQKRIDKLTVQIAERRGKGHDVSDIEKELARVRTSSARSEEIAERRLAQAERADQEKADQETENRLQISADMDEKRKTKAARVWVSEGGDPHEFEAAWPTIRDELIKGAVVDGTKANEKRASNIIGGSL